VSDQVVPHTHTACKTVFYVLIFKFLEEVGKTKDFISEKDVHLYGSISRI